MRLPSDRMKNALWCKMVISGLIMQIIFNMAMSQTMGPFDFEIRTVQNCDRYSGDKLLFESRIIKYNRTIYAISAPIYFAINVDDSLSAMVDLAVFTNGGWKENFYKQKFTEACSTLRKISGKSVSLILSHVGLEDRCPIPKGNYSLKAYPLKFDISFVPAFFYGKYRFNVLVTKDERRVGCLKAVVDIIPKKKKH